MSNIQPRLCAAIAAMGFISLMLAAAAADERICRSAIAAETVDDLRVPRGATCELNGTLVRGNVRVEVNATLLASGVMVIGDVRGDGAKLVSVAGDSRIGGSVQVTRGGGATVEASEVDNNVHYDRNREQVSLLNSKVDGNVQATRNTGGVAIEGNTIAGNLQCRENNPRPTGGGNIVGGDKDGQCRRL